MRKAWRMAAVVTTLALVGGVLIRSGARSAHSASSRPSVRLVEPDYLSYALVRVAHLNGLFSRHGLNVEIIRAPSGRDAVDILLQGKADFAAAAGTPVTYAAMDGHEILILAGMSTVDGAHAIMSPRGAGIRTPFGLRGKRIALAPRTSSEFFLDRYLGLHGISTKSVVRVSAEPGELTSLLEAGKVDAVCTWTPWQLPGNDYVRLGGEGVYTWNSFLVGRRAVVEKDPAVAERLLAALADAESYAMTHRQELAAMLAPEYRMSVRDFENVWSSVRLGVSLDHSMLRGLEDEARWASESGRHAGGVPDFLGVFYFPALTAVRPEAVTIVHDGAVPS